MSENVCGGNREEEKMYLGCSELDLWVVLNLPQSLIEAFPLVGLGVLVFVRQVRKDIFGAKKRPVEGKKRSF